MLKTPFRAAVLIVFAAASCCLAADPNEFLVWSGVLPGRLYVPESYNPAQSYPFIIFCHGMGEKGYNNTSQVNANIDTLLANCRSRGVFLYAPQSPDAMWADTQVASIMAKVDDARLTYNIDQERIYVTGLSAGGLGVFNFMETQTARLAAGVPLCAMSGGDRARDNVLVGKPIWMFHAANDTTTATLVTLTRAVLNGIRAQDGGKPPVVFPLDADPANPYYNTGTPYYTDGTTFYEENHLLYTEYDTGNHTIWDRVYQEQGLWEWLLSQTLTGGTTNYAPIVNVGTDATIIFPTYQVALNASVFDDDLPDPPAQLTLTWTKDSGPGAVIFANPHAAATTATFSAIGQYVLRLSAFDGQRTGTDTIMVTVQGAMVVMDNGDPGYLETGGYWWHGSGGYLNDQAGATNHDGYATYTFSGLAPGRFRVRAQWTWAGNRNTATPYIIYNGTIAGTALGTVYCNQQAAPSGYSYDGFQWTQLGGVYQITGNTLTVKVQVVNGQGYSQTDGMMIERLCLLGDFSGDGVVDQADYTTWADHYGQDDHAALSPGSCNADGVVDQADYTTWADHYGQTLPIEVGTPAVPEVSPAVTPTGDREAAAMKKALRTPVRQSLSAKRQAERAN